jgi:hypothetical protein
VSGSRTTEPIGNSAQATQPGQLSPWATQPKTTQPRATQPKHEYITYIVAAVMVSAYTN